MRTGVVLSGLVIGMLSPAAGLTQETSKLKPPGLQDLVPLLDAGSPQALAGVLRGAMIKYLPNPLFEASPGWGNQRMVANQLKWKRKGIFLRPKIYKTPRNDGTWRKIRLTSNNLPNSLILDIRAVQFPTPDRMTFDLFLAFDARVEYVHHIWESGVRLYAGSVRARFRVNMLLKAEATVKIEPGMVLLPDAVFRLRATSAQVSYDNLVYEHVPGLGGTAAKLIGKTFHSALNQWHPSLERGMLAKANAAIVKAADTKEVRISLERAFAKVIQAEE